MNLKRIIYACSIAASMTLLWVPKAQAIPAFARQVGMPCSACHFQHFPVINSFGRAFKEGGFTMVGSENLITGDNNGKDISLPTVLNAAIELYNGYVKTNGPTAGSTPTTQTTNNGQWQLPGSSSVFFGGRVNQHTGFEAELNMYPTPAGLLNVKVPISYTVGDGSWNLGATVYSTGVYGPSFGMETMDTGANAVHLFNQFDMPTISAQQYINTSTPAAGIDLYLANPDVGFIVLGSWMPDQAPSSGNLTSTYVRAALTNDNLINGWDLGLGFQIFAGHGVSTADIPGTVGGGQNDPGDFFASPFVGIGSVTMPVPGVFNTKAYAIDAQALGTIAGHPLTLIASYANAPSDGMPSGVPDGFQGNLFNPGTATRSSFNVAAEFGVIPDKATIQLAYRNAHSGFAVPGTTITNATDNALLVGATYAMTLNVRLDLTYSHYSGELYDAVSKNLQATGYAGNDVFQAWLITAF